MIAISIIVFGILGFLLAMAFGSYFRDTGFKTLGNIIHILGYMFAGYMFVLLIFYAHTGDLN